MVHELTNQNNVVRQHEHCVVDPMFSIPRWSEEGMSNQEASRHQDRQAARKNAYRPAKVQPGAIHLPQESIIPDNSFQSTVKNRLLIKLFHPILGTTLGTFVPIPTLKPKHICIDAPTRTLEKSNVGPNVTWRIKRITATQVGPRTRQTLACFSLYRSCYEEFLRRVS